MTDMIDMIEQRRTHVARALGAAAGRLFRLKEQEAEAIDARDYATAYAAQQAIPGAWRSLQVAARCADSWGV